MFLASLALAAALPQKPFYSKDFWVVLENTQSCILVGSYSGVRLWIAYDEGLSTSKFIFTDPAFKSATPEKSYALKLTFLRKDMTPEYEGTLVAQGTKLGEDGGVTFTLKGMAPLDYVANSTVFALSLDNNIIGSLSLKGSAEAVKALRTCASLMHLQNPSDPLEGAEIQRREKK